MKTSFHLFINFNEEEIFILVGNFDQENNFKIIEKIELPIIGVNRNKISYLEKISEILKNNILAIEQKINFTFKDLIIILNNFDISFLNLTGFKKLNGTQINKDNITYILNSLKSCVDEYEKKKKILHIFNSKFCLDKKKIENLPIGLFGDFYSHELSFNLINKNDFMNLETIFKSCNLKIKKILLESFVKGSLISDKNSEIGTFFYIQIKEKLSKIIYVENDAIKYEQKFNFGTKIILDDISKITSLSNEVVKKIILNNKNFSKFSKTEVLEKEYFSNQVYRKIKKSLILEIAEARIKELSELYYLKNINLKKSIKSVKVIFLEINDQQYCECFNDVFQKSFAFNNSFEIKIIKKIEIDEIILKANNLVQFGWKKEAIPITLPKKSFLARIFQEIFQ